MELHPLTLTVLALLVSPPGLAHADAGEWRLGAGGGLMVMNSQAGGAAGTGAGYEAHGRLAFGLSNLFELGVVAGYAHASDVTFAGAKIGGQQGTLFADQTAVAIGMELRMAPGIALSRAFVRTGPYLAVRASGAVELRTSQALLTPGGMLIATEDDGLVIVPAVGAAVGVEHRFGDHAFLAAEVAAGVGVKERTLALTAEASWSWY